MYPDPNEPHQLPNPQLPEPQPLPGSGNQPSFSQPYPMPPQQQPVPQQPQYLAPTPDQAYGRPYRSDQGAPNWQQPQQQPATYEQGMPPSADNPQLPQPRSMPQQPIIDYSDNSVQTPTDEKSKKVLLWVVGIIALALVAAAIAAFFILANGNKEDKDSANKAAKDSTSQTKEASLETLEGVTLIPPADLSRYTPNVNNTDVAMAYTTPDGACSLNLGVADADTLPGKDLADIVSRQMKSAREKGLTLTGPTAGSPLELVNASDENKKYSMPTLVFTTSNPDGTRIRSHYSAAVLADGSRVYITRICQSKTADVTDETLKPIDEDATKIAVRS